MAKGRKTGGGSRKGRPNKSTQAIKEIIDSCIDMHEIVSKLGELARGVRVAARKGGRVTIYTEKPDPNAIKILLEYRFGKPAQVINDSLPETDKPFPVILIPPQTDGPTIPDEQSQ